MDIEQAVKHANAAYQEIVRAQACLGDDRSNAFKELELARIRMMGAYEEIKLLCEGGG